MAGRSSLPLGMNSCSSVTTGFHTPARRISVSLSSTATRASFTSRGGGFHKLQVDFESRVSTLHHDYAIRASSNNGVHSDSDGSSSNSEISPEGVLILMRHGESVFNKQNLFAGCVDVPLSERGVREALEAGERIRDIPVDVIFTSDLMRAQMTAMLAMTQHRKQKIPIVLHNESDRAAAWSTIFSEETKEKTIPAVIAWELNERTYGELQGRNKDEIADIYGADQVKIWRRSYDVSPPNGESLAQCAQRAVGYFKKFVEPQLQSGKNVLISAHGNSLRSIIMYLDKLTPQDIIELELSTGTPMLYGYKEGKFIRRGSPVGTSAYGVYALTCELAAYRNELDSFVED